MFWRDACIANCCVDDNIISIVSSLIEFQFLKIKIDFLNPNVISLLYLFDIYLLHVSIIWAYPLHVCYYNATLYLLGWIIVLEKHSYSTWQTLAVFGSSKILREGKKTKKKKNSLPLLASRSSPILKDARRKPDLIAWSDWSTPLNDLFFLSFHEVQTMHKIAALQAFFLYFPSKESSC